MQPIPIDDERTHLGQKVVEHLTREVREQKIKISDLEKRKWILEQKLADAQREPKRIEHLQTLNRALWVVIALLVVVLAGVIVGGNK